MTRFKGMDIKDWLLTIAAVMLTLYFTVSTSGPGSGAPEDDAGYFEYSHGAF